MSQFGVTVTFREKSLLARLAVDRLLDPLADREAGGEHERAEDDAQGGEHRPELLLPERGEGHDEQVSQSHGVSPGEAIAILRKATARP